MADAAVRIEMSPMPTDLDKAKIIIQEHARAGNENFKQLLQLMNGEIEIRDVVFVPSNPNPMTPEERKIMGTVVEELSKHSSTPRTPHDKKLLHAIRESLVAGGKRSKKRSKKHSKKSRRRRTTSRRRSRVAR
jgi:hypothetical protein